MHGSRSIHSRFVAVDIVFLLIPIYLLNYFVGGKVCMRQFIQHYTKHELNLLYKKEKLSSRTG